MSDHSAMPMSGDVILDKPIITVQMQEEIKSPLLRFKDAVRYLQISKETLYRLVARKEITCIRIHRKILFKKKCLDEFIDACEVKGKSNDNDIQVLYE